MVSTSLAGAPRIQKRSFLADWNHVSFVNWPYDPAVLQKRLAPGLQIDTFEGQAWLSLVAFRCARAHADWSPPISFLSNYDQFNLRTYVKGPDGTPGVYFFSMDVNQPLLLLGRWTFGAPYMFSSMRVQVGETMSYSSERRFGGPGCTVDLELKVGEPSPPGQVSAIENFLLYRWWLFAPSHGKLLRAAVSHTPWQPAPAELVSLRQTLVNAAGIPDSPGAPLALHGGSVSSVIGKPELL